MMAKEIRNSIYGTWTSEEDESNQLYTPTWGIFMKGNWIWDFKRNFK